MPLSCLVRRVRIARFACDKFTRFDPDRNHLTWPWTQQWDQLIKTASMSPLCYKSLCVWSRLALHELAIAYTETARGLRGGLMSVCVCSAGQYFYVVNCVQHLWITNFLMYLPNYEELERRAPTFIYIFRYCMLL